MPSFSNKIDPKIKLICLNIVKLYIYIYIADRRPLYFYSCGMRELRLLEIFIMVINNGFKGLIISISNSFCTIYIIVY